MSRIVFCLGPIVPLGMLFALIAGCGAGDGFTGERGSVSGKITFEGKPIPEHSQVIFVGMQGGYTAGAEVKAGGEYSLKFNGSSKLPAMKYTVQINPPAEAAPSVKPIDPMNSADIVKPPSKSPAPADEKGPFPSRYYSRATSKLEFTVKAGNNPANFELTK